MENVNGKSELQSLIPTSWSEDYFEELRPKVQLVGVASADYQGAIAKRGDKVKVPQWVKPEAETLDSDKQQFGTKAAVINQFELECNFITIASFIITDLADLQSISYQEQMKKALTDSVAEKMERQAYAYALSQAGVVSINSAGSFTIDDFSNLSLALSDALVPNEDRYLFLSPRYHHLAGKSSQLSSSDFVPGQPIVDRKLPKIQNFNVAEYNIAATKKQALALHRSALQIATQKQMTIKLSDLHSQQRLGYLVSAHIIWGMKIFDAARMKKITEA